MLRPRSIVHSPGPALVLALVAGLLLAPLTGCGAPDDGDEGRPAGGEASAERGGETSAERGGERRGGRRGGERRGARPAGGPGGPWGAGGDAPPAEGGVPVEVATVDRGSISSFFETHSTLEAENEVDIVARVSGPIVQLAVEEGDRLRRGQLIAKLDDREPRAQLEAARVRLEEAKASFERTRSLFDQELVSRDVFDQARANAETSRAEVERLEVQLDYLTIRAPFAGLIVERYVRFAEFVQGGARLVRLSDFDPLLAPIQVPERHLGRLAVGQRARLTAPAFPDRAFEAEVMRVRPVVDAESGTIEVTLRADGEGALSPGMFATVELEMERRDGALLVPKAALALDALRPTVFVAAAAAEDGAGAVAQRRELEIGLRNDRLLKVVSGLAAGESVVVVGQDGLADGTPIDVGGAALEAVPRPPGGLAPQGAGRGGAPGFLRELDWDDPAQVERVRERMRERGLTEAEIDQRLERIKARLAAGGGSDS